MKSHLSLVALSFLAAAVLAAQTPAPAPAPSSPAFDADACAKHCKEMAAAHQKMMDSQKAMKKKHEAAWKEIEAQLETAKKSRGDKKVAALESAVEKLVAFHNEMQRSMGEGMPGMMRGMPGHSMNCCAGMDHEMGGMPGHTMDGHAGHDMHGMMDCPGEHQAPAKK